MMPGAGAQTDDGTQRGGGPQRGVPLEHHGGQGWRGTDVEVAGDGVGPRPRRSHGPARRPMAPTVLTGWSSRPGSQSVSRSSFAGQTEPVHHGPEVLTREVGFHLLRSIVAVQVDARYRRHPRRPDLDGGHGAALRREGASGRDRMLVPRGWICDRGPPDSVDGVSDAERGEERDKRDKRRAEPGVAALPVDMRMTKPMVAMTNTQKPRCLERSPATAPTAARKPTTPGPTRSIGR